MLVETDEEQFRVEVLNRFPEEGVGCGLGGRGDGVEGVQVEAAADASFSERRISVNLKGEVK